MEHLLKIQPTKPTPPEKDEAIINMNLTPKTLARNIADIGTGIDGVFSEMEGKNVLKIFGICGGSSCGKSKITHYLNSRIPKSIVIAERDFLIDSNKKTPRKKSFYDEKENLFAVTNDQDGYSQERKQKLVDLNDPECYNWESLVETLTQLKNNETALLPFYDHNYEVLLKSRQINSQQVSMIFVEGMFIFKIPKLRELIDFKIFVEVDDDIRLSRMLLHENRYIQSNPPSLKSFFIIFEKFIKASYEKDVEPTKKYANIILPNFDITPDDQIEGNQSLDFLLVNLQNMIKKRLLFLLNKEIK